MAPNSKGRIHLKGAINAINVQLIQPQWIVIIDENSFSSPLCTSLMGQFNGAPSFSGALLFLHSIYTVIKYTLLYNMDIRRNCIPAANHFEFRIIFCLRLRLETLLQQKPYTGYRFNSDSLENVISFAGAPTL